jgi:hypothetical protein
MRDRYRHAASVLPQSLAWWTQRARPQVAWTAPGSEDALVLLADPGG